MGLTLDERLEMPLTAKWYFGKDMSGVILNTESERGWEPQFAHLRTSRIALRSLAISDEPQKFYSAFGEVLISYVLAHSLNTGQLWYQEVELLDHDETGPTRGNGVLRSWLGHKTAAYCHAAQTGNLSAYPGLAPQWVSDLIARDDFSLEALGSQCAIDSYGRIRPGRGWWELASSLETAIVRQNTSAVSVLAEYLNIQNLRQDYGFIYHMFKDVFYICDFSSPADRRSRPTGVMAALLMSLWFDLGNKDKFMETAEQMTAGDFYRWLLHEDDYNALLNIVLTGTGGENDVKAAAHVFAALWKRAIQDPTLKQQFYDLFNRRLDNIGSHHSSTMDRMAIDKFQAGFGERCQMIPGAWDLIQAWA